MQDVTRKFAALDNKAEMKEILNSVYNSLLVKGYNAINQIVGYILSEDPTYITSYNNARSLITRLDRDELLQELLKTYLDKYFSGVIKKRKPGTYRVFLLAGRRDVPRDDHPDCSGSCTGCLAADKSI